MEGTLINGLKWIIEKKNDTKLISFIIFINVGSRDEKIQKLGISHFVEHMIFRGGKLFPSNQDVFKAFDKIGATFNGHTDRDLTWYYTKTTSQYLEDTIKVWSDLILHPKLNESDFKKERQIILREISAIIDDPSSEIWRPFDKIVFNGHPLEKIISGDKKTLDAITLHDIIDFWKKFYVSENMSICVFGDIPDYEHIINLITKYFGVPNSSTFKRWYPYSAFRFEKKKWGDLTHRVNTLDRKNSQEQIIIGFPCFGFWSKYKYPAQFLKIILAGIVSSRLFLAIREKKGLVYGISAELNLYLEGGYFAIKTATKNENLAEVIFIIICEIKDIIDNGIQVDEFEIAKGYIEGKMKISAEDVLELGLFYDKQLAYKVKGFAVGDIICYTEFLQKIKNVKIGDVNKIAAELLDFNRLICVVSGKTQKTDLINIISSNITS